MEGSESGVQMDMPLQWRRAFCDAANLLQADARKGLAGVARWPY